LLAEAGAVDQLHQFLNSTRTLKAEFSQMVVAKNGRKPQQSSGVVAISRPGKLRWDIQKPYPQLVVGDGEKIWIYDRRTEAGDGAQGRAGDQRFAGGAAGR
jgi:outer membrane lipoprotein carrier protein